MRCDVITKDFGILRQTHVAPGAVGHATELTLDDQGVCLGHAACCTALRMNIRSRFMVGSPLAVVSCFWGVVKPFRKFLADESEKTLSCHSSDQWLTEPGINSVFLNIRQPDFHVPHPCIVISLQMR